MKRKLQKAAALTLAGTMILGVVTGCGGDKTAATEAKKDQKTEAGSKEADTNKDTANGSDNGTGKGSENGSESGSEAAKGDYTDYSKGFPEKVTIKIPVYDRGFEGWDPTNNYYTKWIQSEFGDKYNVEVQYVAIGRTTEVTDYMQMIAAGSAPDIIFHYDMPQAVSYYNEGAMQPLDLQEIAYYAPAYSDKLGDTIRDYGEMNGENIFFFADRDAIYYNWVTLIRQDWLDQVKMEMPTNREELEAVAQAWKDAGLGTLGERLVNKSFTYDYAFRGQEVDQTELALYSDLNVPALTWKPTENYLRTLNKEYNEGLIDAEFYLKKEEPDVVGDFVSGKTGTYGFYMTNTTDVINSLTTNDPNAKVAVLDPSAFAPKDSKPYYYEYPSYGMVMGMNAKTTDEQRAAIWMFLDWMIQDDNLFYLQNGVEGQNYTLDEDGIAMPAADFNGESKLSNNNNKDYWCLVAEVASYGDEQKNLKANRKTLAPAGYEDLISQSYDYTKKIESYGLINTIFTKPVESSSEYASDLSALWQEVYVDMVTSAPEEFDEKYKAACEEYLDAGYQEILDEKQALLDEGAYK